MNQNGKKLNRAAAVIAKIMEVLHWVAVGVMSVSFIVYWIDDALLRYFICFGDGEFGVSGWRMCRCCGKSRYFPFRPPLSLPPAASFKKKEIESGTEKKRYSLWLYRFFLYFDAVL